MKQVIGGYATGDRFWDRKEDLKCFIAHIKEGAHLLLTAQRRMGKTSLMLEAARQLRDTYIGLYVDLQQDFSAADAMARLGTATYEYKPLRKKVADTFSNVLTTIGNKIEKISLFEIGVHLRSGLDSGNWRQKGDELLSILAASEKPVLLMFDEIPIMVNRMLKGQEYAITPERIRDVDEFMAWLRRSSILYQGKISIVLTGSIGFEPVLHQAGMSATLNTFRPFELKPWEPAAAISCLRALAEEYGIVFLDGAEDEMVNMLGCCIPAHVQMFFGHVKDRCVRKDIHEFRKEEIAEVYEEDMLGVRGHGELTHYEERLKMVLGLELLPLALDMLSEAAITGYLDRNALQALQQDHVLPGYAAVKAEEDILRVLEHDGYLQQSSHGHEFVSRLIRDWWKRRYSLFFTPVLQRIKGN